MPKGRMLSKKISQDEKVAKLSLCATLLYTWCIPHLDQKGRIFGDVWTLKAVVPHINELNPKAIEKCIEEWINVGLVKYYGHDLKYMEFIGFLKNQSIREDRESESVIPSPEEVRSSSGETRLQIKSNQIKLKQIKLKQTNLSSFAKDVVTKWNVFCERFPKVSRVKELTPSRREKLKVRYEEASFRNFDSIIDALTQQAFCRGGGAKKWVASFDWIIANDTNYMKVLEFKYKKGDSEDVPESLRDLIKS